MFRPLRAIVSFGLFAAAVALPGAAAQAGGCSGSSCEDEVTVKAGRSVILAAGINQMQEETCEFQTPDIQTTVEPHLGRVVPKVVPVVIQSTDSLGVDAGPCKGKRTKGLRLIYFANPGASGTDEVVITVRGTTVHWTINVR
jgi:hypothetical protein